MRRQRGSRRYLKIRRRIARLRASNAQARISVAHNLWTKLAHTAGMIAIEDLRTGNMTASAKGTITAPGKQVKRKSRLNGAILNVGWHRFATMLAYKLDADINAAGNILDLAISGEERHRMNTTVLNLEEFLVADLQAP